MTPEAVQRYSRHLLLKEIGGPGQATLGRATVAVIGAGGIGSPALLYLAAAGVGRLILIDDDRVDLSNLNRQIAHSTARVGALKVESAAEALRALNPGVTLTLHAERATEASIDRLLAGADAVIDGSDSFDTRRLVADACARLRRPLISAAVVQLSGQLTVFKPYLGPEHPGFAALYPTPPAAGALPSCAETGILGPAAGVMGTLAAVEAIKELLGLGESLSGWLLLYEALWSSLDRVQIG
ncbi:HesA/MoeB/ThiF family protein [Elstera cyanobacteriorum]|uniref:HesA/MoeB/ThiF family protein n=1 Tax=Elstera cyanobacteriorum TaxID=2022747 RepID=UPI002352DB98|nr:HesA/MoeB/ThiF family protein [Elstera cyanobacteriorum]MCK6441804.1 HesA/MoeB/ThiF family protein [Elstera cyanobacteriorum]